MERTQQYLWGRCEICGQPGSAQDDLTQPNDARMVCWRCRKNSQVEKNRAYGNSALNPLRVFARDVDPLTAIRVRVDDKLSRLARGRKAGEDPYVDLVGYLVLYLIGRDQETKPVKKP